MTEETNALPAGYNLHRYQIKGVLGAGGFGITYRAMHEALQNEVAIKEYFPAEWAYRDHNGVNVRANAQGQQPARQGEPPCYQWGLERFLDEAKILVQVNHPGVVRVRDYFTANGSAYIVMEFEEGESLSAMLQRGGILPEPELRRLLDDIMPALEAVHSQNYLHRDLKPGNLYVRKRDGHVMLLDFGAARQALGRRTRSVTSVVTPGYSPIEQYVTVGEDYGPWTDIYALGAVMYRCITGAPPIEAPGRVLKDPVQPAMEVGAGLYSRGLLQVVDQALAVRPEDRFQSVAAMRQALQAAEPASDYGDFSQVPPIRDHLLDLPSMAPSLRFEPIPPRSELRPPPPSVSLPPPTKSPWTLDELEPRLEPVSTGNRGKLASLEAADSDLSLPMLENIWEQLDDRAPPAEPPAAPEPAPEAASAPGLSEPLLKRSPLSALEHLKKASSISRRTQTTEARSSAPTQVGTEEKEVSAATAHGSVQAVVEPAVEGHSINWTRILLTVFAVSGLSGIGLLSYEYYHAVQQQRAQEAAALQRQQEEEAARRAEEEARQRTAEFAQRLDQARKAITDRAWERAERLLDQAAALDAQNPALARVRTELQEARKPGAAVTTRIDPATGIEFHWIEGGCFSMGSPPAERDRGGDESSHSVCVKSFWISKTEIANNQFQRFQSAHDSGSFQGRSLNGDTQPAVNVRWDDAQAFVEWLTWEGNGQRFRLPTEAEWEYAARAGTTTRYYWGNDIDPRYANFSDRNDPTGASVGNLNDGQSVTAPVGTYLPNAFGLHDMAGNVWEWTCSEYLPNYGSEEQRCSARRTGEGQRTVRGGSWNNGPGELRSAKRLPRKPNHRDGLTGFRVVMEE